MKTDLHTFLVVDHLYDPRTPSPERIAALRDPEWQVRQAALWAMTQHPDPQAVPGIVAVLDEEDASDVYGGAPWGPSREGAPEEVREAWRRRYRVKQAACGALEAIARAHGRPCLGEAVIRRLARYATSPDEDYAVRVAACAALGAAGQGHEAAVTALRQACDDIEWCTATTARKALEAMNARRISNREPTDRSIP